MAEPSVLQKHLGSIAIPDLDTLLIQKRRVGVSAHEPQQLLNDTAEEGAFGGEEGQCGVGEGKAQGGRGEEGKGAGSSAVCACFAAVDDAPDE
jgi:hypothetical protein